MEYRILTPLNQDVDEKNAYISNIYFKGENGNSVDVMQDREEANVIPEEYLHTLTLSGIP